MRVAICLFGLVGGKSGKNGAGDSVDAEIAYKHYKKHIFDVNDNVDIFVHSWSVDKRSDILELYKPKKYIIEPQKYFLESALHSRLWSPIFISVAKVKTIVKLYLCKFFKPIVYKKMMMTKYEESFRAYSRWYSSKKSLELKKIYEDENSFKYDVVMISRFDVAFFSDLNFEQYDMKYFYTSHWNDLPLEGQDKEFANLVNQYEGKRLIDFWFFSNSVNMDKFSKLYNRIEDYSIDVHYASKQHVDRVIGKDKIRYIFYRWFDYETIRLKFFKSTE